MDRRGPLQRACTNSSQPARSMASRRSTAGGIAAASRLAHGPAVVADGELEARRPARRRGGRAPVRTRCWTPTPTPSGSTRRWGRPLVARPRSPPRPAAASRAASTPARRRSAPSSASRCRSRPPARQAARLVQRCGERLPEPVGAVTHLFPEPAALAALDPETLRCRAPAARAIVALAAALADGLRPDEQRDELLALPGIGPWTADYVAMRCGDPDVLLETDLGVRRGLKAIGGPDDLAAPRRALAAVALLRCSTPLEPGMRYTTMDTPIGELTLIGDEDALTGVFMGPTAPSTPNGPTTPRRWPRRSPSSSSTSRASAPSSTCRSRPAAPSSSTACGGCCARSRTGRRPPTARSPSGSGTRARSAPSASPTAATRSRSSSPATA